MKNQRRRRAKQIRRQGGVRTPESLKALMRSLMFSTNPFWRRDPDAVIDPATIKPAMRELFNKCARGPQ